MEIQTKLCKVIKHPDNLPEQANRLIYGDWLIFNDFWISPSDKYVKNQRTGKTHKILKHDFIEMNVWNGPRERPEWLKHEYLYPVNMWERQKLSMIRVDNQEEVQIDDLFEVIQNL